MVAISSLKDSLKEHELFLYSDKTLKTLKEFYDKKDFTFDDRILNEILKDIKSNTDLKFSEKKYLSWIRHSEAFISEEYSPKEVASSWTESVEGLLKEAWSKHFDEDDKISLAYMGKLGSRELNLSSDIDLIFFGEPGYLKKVRALVSRI
jgi:glutamine synthetase adenylyltransferase